MQGQVDDLNIDFALLITWTTFGTWLPGDRRGYVSNTLRDDGSFAPKHNITGTPVMAADRKTWFNARRLQRFPTVRLIQPQPIVVAEAIVAASIERGWQILRAAIMWNHVHVLITRCPDGGPAVRRILKGVSQAALSKSAGRPKRWWTAGGSNRYLHGNRAVHAAFSYVANQPGKLADVLHNQVHRCNSTTSPQ